MDGPADIEAFITGEKRRLEGAGSVGIARITPATPALLLLTDRADLAEAIRAPQSERTAFELATWLRQRYMMQVAQALIDHRDAEGAHSSSLMLLASTVQANDKVQSRFQRRPPSISDLEACRAIYVDIVRRAAGFKDVKAALATAKELDPPRRRILYIEYLDEVQGSQLRHPAWAWPPYNQDPIYQAIVAEGSAIVPALIDTLENDSRYTRSISRGDKDFALRTIHSVRDVVRALLSRIWPSSERWAAYDPSDMAQDLRKAWKIDSRLTEPERWANLLADDSAGRATWLDADLYLVSPAGEIQFSPYNYQASRNWTGAIKGEALRKSKGREIADLMDKRALDVVFATTRSTENPDAATDALLMAHCLARWGPSGYTDTLAKLIHHALDLQFGQQPNVLVTSWESYGEVCADRLLRQDRPALADYLCGLARMESANAWISPDALMPFWALPKDPNVQAAAESFMASEKSHLLSSDPRVVTKAVYGFAWRYTNSPLLSARAFRQTLVAGLFNESVTGQGWLWGQGPIRMINYSFGGGPSGSVSVTGAPDLPPGERATISIGDVLAQIVAAIKGAPSFWMVWDPARRKAAKQALADWLANDTRDWVAIARSSPLYSETY